MYVHVHCMETDRDRQRERERERERELTHYKYLLWQELAHKSAGVQSRQSTT